MSRSTLALAPLLGAALAIALVRAPAEAGPVPGTSAPNQTIEEVEKAGVALQKGQFDDAYKLLQEAVKKHPQLAPARLIMARMLSRVKDMGAQARAQLELAASENPDHPEIYLTNGSIALGEGRVMDTILNCRTALLLADADRWTADQKKTFRREAHGGLATAFEVRKDWANSRSHLAAWLEIDAKNGQLRQRLARALFFLDKADDAFYELGNAVKDDPSLPPPSVTMSQLWTVKQDFKKAREWLDKAIKAEGNSVRVHLAYADWLLQQNEIDQAKIHVDAAEKIDAKSLEVMKLKGVIARVQKDLKAAQVLFQTVIAQAPADLMAANQLALVLADQTDERQRNIAVQHAEINARGNQNSPEILATLGYVYFRVGRIDDAMKALQVAVSGGQITSDTAYYLALAFNEKEKYEEVDKLLDPSLKAKGLFIYRTEAQKLLDQVKPKLPKDKEKDKKTKD